jgi:exodeoxyribonuclease V alpha subunit
LTADRIASSVGISDDSPLRLSAAALYCLEQASTDGHTALPPEQLIAAIISLLQCDAEQAQVGIDTALRDGKVIRELFPEGVAYPMLYYSRKLYSAERRLADTLRMLLRVKELPEESQYRDDENFDAVAEAMVRRLRKRNSNSTVELNEEQQQACISAKSYPISIITGGPGVGKTTVIAQIVREALEKHWVLRLAAPTGRAARRLSESAGLTATTIHRLLQYDPQTKKFVFDENEPLKCDMLIIDEVSMLDIFLARSLFAAVRPGTRVILVGDRDQLPSVGPGAVLQDLINCGRIPVTELKRIYRQREGSRIVTSAHDVNHGIVPSLANPPRGTRGDFYFYEYRDASAAAEFTRKLVCNHIPAFFGFDSMDDIQVLTPMRRGECGVNALNESIQALLNPPSEEKPEIVLNGDTPRIFRLGDRVMQIKNNYDKQIYNGEMGRIISMDPGNRSFTVLFDSARVAYKADETDQLTLCYAITIHKSQGSEFPVVVMPMLDQHHIMLQRNLLYTGMTRAKKLFIIVGSRFAVQTAVKNNTPTMRISMLRYRLER